MNQLTSGENDFENVSEPTTKTLKTKLEELDASLYQLDASLGLDCEETCLDISGYLTMSRGEIESLTPEVASRIAHEIHLSIFHLQKTINRNTARLKWCERTLNVVFGELARGYRDVFGWEEKKVTIIADNVYAKKLSDRIIIYQSRVDSLYNLTGSLKGIADSCKNIQYLKTSKDRNY